MPSAIRSPGWLHSRRRYLPFVGFALLAIVSIGPLLLERLPVELYVVHTIWQTTLPQIAVTCALIAVIALRAKLDSADEPRSFLLALVFALFSAMMTWLHWAMIDSNPQLHQWQQQMYGQILNHQAGAPHQYRPLPYGFARTLELITGNWAFACIAYRLFFNYWFVWVWYHFARLFLPRWRALSTLLVLLAYYPLSIRVYWGQLTDPLSHFLFVLAMIYALRDRWILLALSLALGVVAKETAVLMVPVYLACHWRKGWMVIGKSAALGAICTVAFCAPRLPLGWFPGSAAAMNGDGIMIAKNLQHFDLMHPMFDGGPLVIDSYLHVLFFVIPFAPLIISNWRRIDRRLRAMLVVLTPLLLLSNLCFGWLFESRNYMPLLPLMTTTAMPGLRRRQTTLLQAERPNQRAQRKST